MKARFVGLMAAVLMGAAAVSQAAFQAAPIAGALEGRKMTLGVQGSVGVLNGEAKEHVYDYETPDGSRRQLSRLDWELKNVVLAGGNVSVRVLEHLTLNGGLWLALSEGSGEMEDYDWLELGYSGPTHYSLSDVKVTEGYLFDVNAAWDWDVLETLTVRAMAGYKQNGWTWEDSGVYALYPEYGYVPMYLGGENMINYEQEFLMPYVGANADWRWNGFAVSGYLVYSPYVTATDWDEHVARGMHFKETFDGGDMLGAGVEARYEFATGSLRGVFLTAALEHQKISRMVGDMDAYGDEGAVYGEKDVAGIENAYTVFSVGGGFRF